MDKPYLSGGDKVTITKIRKPNFTEEIEFQFDVVQGEPVAIKSSCSKEVRNIFKIAGNVIDVVPNGAENEFLLRTQEFCFDVTKH